MRIGSFVLGNLIAAVCMIFAFRALFHGYDFFDVRMAIGLGLTGMVVVLFVEYIGKRIDRRNITRLRDERMKQ